MILTRHAWKIIPNYMYMTQHLGRLKFLLWFMQLQNENTFYTTTLENSWHIKNSLIDIKWNLAHYILLCSQCHQKQMKNKGNTKTEADKKSKLVWQCWKSFQHWYNVCTVYLRIVQCACILGTKGNSCIANLFIMR